jgi:hypothetical protein
MHTPPNSSSQDLLRATAAVLGLTAAEAQRLVVGDAFDFGCGLRARFIFDEHESANVRAQVLLGLPASAMAGDDVPRLLALQSAFAADGNFLLGMGVDGLLELTAQHARNDAAAAAADLEVGCITGWMVLRLLLNEPLQDDTGELQQAA